MAYQGFPNILISSLVCQQDGGSLVLAGADAKVFIWNAELVCKRCNSTYHIENGILNGLEANSLTREMREEKAARDRQARHYDERLAPRFEREVVPTLEALGDVAGRDIIEYGCGTGRLTSELLARNARVLACDFSYASLKVLAESVSREYIVGLVCADAATFKTKENRFAGALAAQFFEHLPTDEKRRTFLGNVSQTLAMGARFTATLYHHDIRRALSGKAKEGYHHGGIYHYYFSTREVRELWRSCFKIVDMRIVDVVLPLMRRLRISERVVNKCSRIVERIPLLNRFGHLVCVTAMPRTQTKT